MAQVAMRRRLVNPGRRKNKARRKKLTAKQIRFFGTKRQRAALKAGRKRKSGRKRNYGNRYSPPAVAAYKNPTRRKRRRNRAAKRKSNVGEVITIGLQGVSNSGTKRRNPGVAKRRKRRATGRRRVTRRRRRNPVVRANPVRRRRRARRNYGVARRRRRNYGVRRRGRRRNPGMLQGRAGQVMGVIGGASLTGIICNTLVPAQLRGGFVGYLSTAAVAMLQGTLVGKVLKNRTLGANMTLGGFVYLGLKVINDLAGPAIAGQIPIGLRGRRGVGLLAGGNAFSIPRTFATNSMTQSYMRPVPAPMSGLGNRGLTLARRLPLRAA